MRPAYVTNLALAGLAATLTFTAAAHAQPPAPPAAPAASPPTATPSAAAPAASPPAATPAMPPPGYAYPPAYAYPPGYPVPPGTAYPAYPGYPAYPPGTAPYPPGYPPYAYAAPPPPPAPPAPPSPPPSGKLRLGAALFLLPQGDLTYDLEYRGEPQDYYARGTSATAGFSAFVEYDLFRHLFVGAALQLTPTLKWQPPARLSSSTTSAYGGDLRAFDLLPEVGVSLSPTPRLRVLAYGAPGYSLMDASGFHGFVLPVKLGTMHGFVMQTGGGMQFAIGQHGFFGARIFYQRGWHKQQIESSTTGQSAEAQIRTSFFGVQASVGYWF